MACVGFAIIVAVIVLLVYLFDENLRRGRAFKKELAARPQISDNEMMSRYFAVDEVAPDVPGKVRRIFAENMRYPAEKLLPDDDFAFFWFGLDATDFVKELESAFGITFSDKEMEQTSCTIRAASALVTDILRRTSLSTHTEGYIDQALRGGRPKCRAGGAKSRNPGYPDWHRECGCGTALTVVKLLHPFEKPDYFFTFGFILFGLVMVGKAVYGFVRYSNLQKLLRTQQNGSKQS